jgi:hypothetical protein
MHLGQRFRKACRASSDPQKTGRPCGQRVVPGPVRPAIPFGTFCIDIIPDRLYFILIGLYSICEVVGRQQLQG